VFGDEACEAITFEVLPEALDRIEAGNVGRETHWFDVIGDRTRVVLCQPALSRSSITFLPGVARVSCAMMSTKSGKTCVSQCGRIAPFA